MAAEPLWLIADDVYAIHQEQLTLFGGLAGVKDDNLIQSACAAPRHLFLYKGEEDALVLGIKLCLALAKNHGFVDGNKRTATAALIEFLAINGYDLLVPDDEEDAPILGLWIERAVQDLLNAGELYDRFEHFVQPVKD